MKLSKKAVGYVIYPPIQPSNHPHFMSSSPLSSSATRPLNLLHTTSLSLFFPFTFSRRPNSYRGSLVSTARSADPAPLSPLLSSPLSHSFDVLCPSPLHNHCHFLLPSVLGFTLLYRLLQYPPPISFYLCPDGCSLLKVPLPP